MFIADPENKETDPGEPDGADHARDNEIICNRIKSPLFQVITVVNIEDVTCLNVHRGSNPEAEVQCFGQEHKIQILFTGDMER